MIYHKVIKNSRGKLKPVCQPHSPIGWQKVKNGLVNCAACLQGKKQKPLSLKVLLGVNKS